MTKETKTAIFRDTEDRLEMAGNKIHATIVCLRNAKMADESTINDLVSRLREISNEIEAHARSLRREAE